MGKALYHYCMYIQKTLNIINVTSVIEWLANLLLLYLLKE